MRGRGGSLLTVKKSRYALTSYSLSLRSRYCTSKPHTRSMRITTRVDFLQIGRPPHALQKCQKMMKEAEFTFSKIN